MTTLKRTINGFQDQLSLKVGQKYCRMLPLEHSAILSTFIKLPVVIKTFVLSTFEWLFYTGFTVQYLYLLPIFYVLNMSSADYACCIYSKFNALLNTFTMVANTMNPKGAV